MKNKLLKLLNLTSSSNDNEALVTIKKANIILKSNNTSWNEVFKDKEYKNNDNVILRMNIQQEQSYSRMIKKDKIILQNIITILIIIIIVLICVLIKYIYY